MVLYRFPHAPRSAGGRPLAMALVSLLGALPCAHAQRLTLAQLESGRETPTWNRPARVTFPSGQPYVLYGTSRRGVEDMRRNAGFMLWFTGENPTSPETPFLLSMLGRHYADLDEDAAAYKVLQRVAALPAGTPHAGRQPFQTLEAVQDEARFELLRILARNRLAPETRALLDTLPVDTGYRNLLAAQALILVGQRDEALAHLQTAKGGGHLDRNFSDVFVRVRAATLARAINRNDLVLDIAQPILEKPMTAQKFPQWQAAWSILDSLAGRARAERHADPRQLKDGVYRGACRGFIGPVEVAVTVRAGRVAEARVTSTSEDRPWSALSVVPARVVAQQSLAVDAVTGATITSCAVLSAIDDALSPAK